MLLSKIYPLWYNGAGMHELLGITKASFDGKTATQSNRKALAEYFLDKINYASMPGSVASRGLYGGSLAAERVSTSQMEYIHHNAQTEIESKWQHPMYTDEQVSEMLFADMLQDEFKKISKSKEVILKL